MLHSNIYTQQKTESFFAYDFNDKAFFLSEELDKGKPIFINFFATWCSPCRQELPLIEKLYKKNPQVTFFIIDVDNLSQNNVTKKEPPRDLVYNILKEKISFPKNQLLYDRYAVIAQKYKVDQTGLPASYLISKKGLIISRYGKIDSKSMVEVQKDINRL